MILDLLERLATLRVVLASSSPRRREILTSLGLAVDVVPSTFPEDLDKAKFTPTAYVAENALQKALEVFVRTAGADASAGPSKPLLLISSDSVVVHGEHILEKPRDEGQARAMLAMLSGGQHCVMSSVCLMTTLPLGEPSSLESAVPALTIGKHTVGGVDATVLQFVARTEVEFSVIPEAVLDAYVRTPEPYDKAGGYGIQSTGAQFVRRIAGDYYTVMGLPLHDLCACLRALVLSSALAPAAAEAGTTSEAGEGGSSAAGEAGTGRSEDAATSAR